MIGTTISHYRILDKLGEGGMGVVYKAHDTKLDRIVALKFLSHRLDSNDTEQSRFVQEARAAAAVNHPNVCSVIDVREENGEQFIVMEFVDGVTLRQKSPVASINEAIGYAIQIGEALQAAHVKGIVHRDVKSENILVTTDGRVKVMDFGLAKLKGSLRMTRTNSTLGTLAYMAPEQVQGGEVDARSDIFSFGVVLFEMLTGKFPFRGEHDAAIMYSILNEQPASVSSLRPDVPEGIDRVIQRALEKDPAERFQHVDDMVSELRRVKKSASQSVRRETAEGKPSGTEHVSSPPWNKKLLRSLWAGGVFVVILVTAGYLFFGKSGARIPSIAVLPFVNAGKDSSMEYLSDGFTEGLINSLSKLPGLKLMSRSTVFRYKGKDVEPQDVGKKLGVAAVVLGRISQRGDELDVSVELVNTDDESHIWGEHYNRRASEIVSLQGEIAGEVSKELHMTLTGEQRRELAKPTTESTEAYQLYLKGRFHLNKRTPEGFARALDYFQRAVQADSLFALAYSGISDCYNLQGSYFLIPSRVAGPLGKTWVMKALALDDNVAEAHTGLASVSESFEWNWSAAEKHYKRAIAINPSYATAHQWYSEFLVAMGRYDEAIVQARLAEEVDPLSPAVLVSASVAFQVTGRYDEARVRCSKAIELNPRFARAYSGRAASALYQGKASEAIEDMRMAVTVSDSGDEYRAYLGFLYGQSHQENRAREILRSLISPSPPRYVPPYFVAVVYAGLGESDNVFLWLDRALEERSYVLECMKYDIYWDQLRKDARFIALTRKVGLPE